MPLKKQIEKKIEYFELLEGHWAETDCIKIWLNRCINFDDNALFTTILHEVLHGIVLHNGKELSEFTEHRLMYEISPTLV